MTKLAWLCVMVVAISPLACTTPSDGSTGAASGAPELIGSDKAAICYVTSAPPAGFTADVARSLDAYNVILPSDNAYTRLVLAGRAVTDAGQPIESIRLRVTE